MKKLFSTYKIIILAIAILFSVNEIKAQCEITIEGDHPQPVCYNDELVLSVPLNINYSYAWTHGNDTIGEGASVLVTITENNSVYNVSVYNTETGAPICDNSVTIMMRPRFAIDFEQIAMTCSNINDDNGKTGKVKATAHDSLGIYTNFTYHWNAPIQPIQYLDDPQIAIGLSAYTNYTMTVTNEYGCSQTDTIQLSAYPNPRIEIFSDPSDTVYLDNPYVTWWFNQTDTLAEIDDFYWEFDGYDHTFTNSKPKVSFSDDGIKYASLTVTNEQGCDTTFRKSIDVQPVRLKIPNIFTPNGDGYNDYFQIGYGEDGQPINDLNAYFLSHKLVIFNRWGRIVYQSTNYQNDWDGGKLPDGTYFYVLDCKGQTQNYNYKGSVMIFDSGR